MKKHKNKIIAGIVIAAVLVFSFWYGGGSPDSQGWKGVKKETSVISNSENANSGNKSDEIKKNTPHSDKAASMSVKENEVGDKEEKAVHKAESEENFDGELRQEKDDYLTEPIPEGKPYPTEPQDTVISDKELTCTLSVRCDTILDNIDWLDKEKVEIVPDDGVIYAEKTVTFYEGESVFNILLREMKRSKIHMEFENTPIYNSAYIEGIANLYEFDCGELSGWMYRVNGWFPNYGCSRYLLKAGDKVEWVYTCNLGIDVGGSYSTRNGR